MKGVYLINLESRQLEIETNENLYIDNLIDVSMILRSPIDGIINKWGLLLL